MSVNQDRRSDETIAQLRQVITRGETGLNNVPGLLKMVLKESMWKYRVIPQTGQSVEFERFIDFVNTPPLEGLGANLDLVKRICWDDLEALDLLDQAVANPHGGDRKSINVNNIHVDIEKRPKGTSRLRTLRELRTNHPELHEKVLKGELSANQAAIQAGSRKKRLAIVLEPEQAAKTLVRHFDRDQLKQLLHFIAEQL